MVSCGPSFEMFLFVHVILVLVEIVFLIRFWHILFEHSFFSGFAVERAYPITTIYHYHLFLPCYWREARHSKYRWFLDLLAFFWGSRGVLALIL